MSITDHATDREALEHICDRFMNGWFPDPELRWRDRATGEFHTGAWCKDDSNRSDRRAGNRSLLLYPLTATELVLLAASAERVAGS